MKWLTNIDLNKNELQNVTMQKLATEPSNPFKGQMYFNTTENRLKYYSGSTWIYADAQSALTSGEAIVTAINGSTSLIDDNNLSANANDAITNRHAHSNKAVLDAITASYTASEQTKLAGLSNYSHPIGDGNLHVPATFATNNGKVLTAGATAGSLSWNTPTVDWSNVANKPASAVANIDTAVSNSHTHSNKALLDTYTQTEANLASSVSLKHTQNTDTGTNSDIFGIGATGVKIKNNGGTELQIRNNGDTDYADIRVNNLYVEGTTTSVNSNTVNIGDSDIELNSDVTTSAMNSDGGITIKRLAQDNITRKDAKLTFNSSTNRWQTTQGDIADTLVTLVIANKVTTTIGDNVLTSIAVNHNLNTRDLAVTVREAASPYAMVIPDIEFTDLNTITFKFATPPTNGQYQVTIIG